MGTSIVESHYLDIWEDGSTEEEFYTRVENYEPAVFIDPITGEEQHGHISTCDTSSIRFSIFKGADSSMEKGLVSGWANVSKNADGSIPLDWQGDIIAPDTLEDAAIEFMLNYQDSGELHEGGPVGKVVESIVLTKDKQAAMGIPEGIVPEGWFITVKLFDDAVIEKVKSGEYQMFSIQGTGQRVAV